MACVCDRFFLKKTHQTSFFLSFFEFVLAIDFFALSRFLRAVVFHQEDFLYARNERQKSDTRESDTYTKPVHNRALFFGSWCKRSRSR